MTVVDKSLVLNTGTNKSNNTGGSKFQVLPMIQGGGGCITYSITTLYQSMIVVDNYSLFNENSKVLTYIRGITLSMVPTTQEG